MKCDGSSAHSEITGQDTQPGDNFGDSVALDEGLGVVGAPAHNTGRP
jgi:hypothetical protein